MDNREKIVTVPSFLSVGMHTPRLIHTVKRKFQCQKCDKMFTHASNLHRHKLIHTGERKFQCQICDKRFTDASNLHSHELIHTGERIFKCQIVTQDLRMHPIYIDIS